MNSAPFLPAKKVRLLLPIAVGFGLFLIVVGLVVGGLGGAILMAAIFALLTGIYSLITRRPSWAGLTGRKAALVTVGFSLVGLMVGGAIMPASDDTVPMAVAEQTPTATPTASQAPSATPTPSATPSSTPTPTPTPTHADTAPVDGADVAVADGNPGAPQNQPEYGVRALALLETLAVKGRAPKTGYDREQFGRAWVDVDRNGCDTRNDMLNRDLTEIQHANSVPCKVSSGVLADPYTDTVIAFLRGQKTSIRVQIDHVVPLM